MKEQKEKKSIFEKICYHSVDIMMLTMTGVVALIYTAPIISGLRERSYIRKTRMSNIKELQKSGANINVNLNGDI